MWRFVDLRNVEPLSRLLASALTEEQEITPEAAAAMNLWERGNRRDAEYQEDPVAG